MIQRFSGLHCPMQAFPSPAVLCLCVLFCFFCVVRDTALRDWTEFQFLYILTKMTILTNFEGVLAQRRRLGKQLLVKSVLNSSTNSRTFSVTDSEI